VSWKVGIVVAGLLVAAIALASVLQDPETGTATWDSTRAAGFAGYLLLWVSVVLGIAVHFRLRPGGAPVTWAVESHRITSVLALSFVAAHVFALLLDDVVHFSLLDALVPFTSTFRPVQVGAGTIAQWLLAVVLASTAMSSSLPYLLWRRLHYLSFPCWLLALVHGITSGSDSSAGPALGVYAITAASVAALFVARLYGRGFVAAGEEIRPSV
jgi:predicted ferric reductase